MINSKKAQTMLSLVFLISGVMIAIGTVVAVVAVSFVSSIYAYRSTSLVEARAESGIEDAVLKIERNNSFTGQYNIDFSNGLVTVTVTSNPPNQDTVIAFSQLANTQQEIIANVMIDPITKIVTVTSMQKQNI